MKRTHTKLNTAEGQTKRFGVGMLSPTVVILLIMTAYPLIFTFFYSFTNYNLLPQSALAGQNHCFPELCQAAQGSLFPAVHLEHRQVHHLCSYF